MKRFALILLACYVAGQNYNDRYNQQGPQQYDPRPYSSDPNQSRDGRYDQYGSDRDRDRYDPNNPNHDRNNPNFDINNPNYDRNNPNFDRNNPNFDKNNPNYDRNNPNYDRNNPNYDRNNPNYDRNNPNFDKNNPNYDRNNPNYDRNNPNYDRNNPNYDRNNPNYDRNNPSSNYDRNNPNYDRNNPNFDRNNPNIDRNNPNYDRNNQNYDRNNPNNPNYDRAGQNGSFNDRNNQYNPGQYDRNFGGYGGSRIDDTNCCEEYCYRQDKDPYIKFGAKTAYTFTFGKSSTQHRVPQCKPIQFWQIVRHGTHLPSQDDIRRLQQLSRIHDEIVRNYQERRSFPDKGKLCAEDYQLLSNWRWNDTISFHNAKTLTDQGIMDIKFMARRYQTRFKELLSVPYSDSYYFFQYTDADRTRDSYQAYIDGLFGPSAYQVHANIQTSENIIKPYQSCNAWRQNVEYNPETTMEYEKFKQKQEYKDLIRNVFRRLGFRFNLNGSIIEDMYDMCRFDKAWMVDRYSPWCAAFTKEQLRLLEYGEDLRYFYKSGYGHDMNKQVGCPPLKDMYERFERTVNGLRNEPKVTVYFTHNKAIQTLLVAMGLYKDYIPLTADNYFTQARRQWKTSSLTPFGANLAAILYECDQGEKNRVMFFLNEVPVDMPGCQVGLCNWSTIKEKLMDTAINCNLDFCDRGAANSLGSSFFFSLFTSIISIAIYKLYF